MGDGESVKRRSAPLAIDAVFQYAAARTARGKAKDEIPDQPAAAGVNPASWRDLDHS
jgi:hypothetical protein